MTNKKEKKTQENINIPKIDSGVKLLNLLDNIVANLEVEIVINNKNYSEINRILRQPKAIIKLAKLNLHFSNFAKISCGILILESIYHPKLKITSITFDNRQVRNSKDLEELMLLLNKQSKLKALGLRFGTLKRKEVKVLSDNLANLNLLYLDLAYNNIDVKQVKNISFSLSSMKKLTHLDLSHNCLGAEGIESISSNLPNLAKLTYLDLKGNGIGADGTSSLITAIFKRLKNVVYLGLRSNDLKNEGIKNLASSLSQMKKLTHLDLGDNNIAEEGAEILATTIPKQLNYLDLSGNDIDQESLEFLKNTLRKRRCNIVNIILSLKNKIPSPKTFVASTDPLSKSKNKQRS